MGLIGELTATPVRKVLLAATGAIGIAALIDGPSDFVEHVKLMPKLVKRAIEDPHQTWFVVSHPNRPWLYSMGYEILNDSHAAERRNFGKADAIDNEGDAFRHAYAAALMTLRAMRDHGVSQSKAAALSHEAGVAHESDGADNPAGKLSSRMDLYNNQVGIKLVGSGRVDGIWLSEQELERKVLDALENGKLREIDPDQKRLTVAQSK